MSWPPIITTKRDSSSVAGLRLNAPDALNLRRNPPSRNFQATLLNAPVIPVLSGSAVSIETF